MDGSPPHPWSELLERSWVSKAVFHVFSSPHITDFCIPLALYSHGPPPPPHTSSSRLLSFFVPPPHTVSLSLFSSCQPRNTGRFRFLRIKFQPSVHTVLLMLLMMPSSVTQRKKTPRSN